MLCIALWVPHFIWNIRRGKARGHTWFTWWKPRGHSDIGPDVGDSDRLDPAQTMRGGSLLNWADASRDQAGNAALVANRAEVLTGPLVPSR